MKFILTDIPEILEENTCYINYGSRIAVHLCPKCKSKTTVSFDDKDKQRMSFGATEPMAEISFAFLNPIEHNCGIKYYINDSEIQYIRT